MNQPSAESTAHSATDGQKVSAAQQKEVFYSPASEELIAARREFCRWSFDKTHERIRKTKRVRGSELLQQEEDKAALLLYENGRKLHLSASEFGDERALTCVKYSSDGAALATGSLACTVKIWDAKKMTRAKSLSGHVERITGLSWRPSTSADHIERHLLASSSADGSCILWDARTQFEDGSSAPAHGIYRKFTGHEGVVGDCDFHPMGRHIGTAGHDYTWRLWDIETGAELLLQDGHIKECSAISFQCDGSLVLTCDWAGVALLWDIRSGQCIHVFQGHVQKIVCASFSPNGFQVATGSTDHVVRIFDLRKKKCWYTLPAHSNVISDLAYSKSGEMLVTSSFDGTAKLWNARDLEIIRTLSGHTGKVMSCDMSPTENEVATGGFDRTLKLWGINDI